MASYFSFEEENKMLKNKINDLENELADSKIIFKPSKKSEALNDEYNFNHDEAMELVYKYFGVL